MCTKQSDGRTLAELAAEAMETMQACNLSGVVHSWSRSINRLRQILSTEADYSTAKVNNHPINQMYAVAVAWLTGQDSTDYSDIHAECSALAGK